MVDDPNAGNPALARFRVERVVRDDGRYLLYYSWPDGTGHPAADAAMGGPAGAAESDTPGELPSQPWTPEAGPARRDESDV